MKQKSTFLKVFMTLLLLMGVSSVWAEDFAPVNTVLWGENFAHFGTKTPSAAGTGTGTTIYGNATITYAQSSTNTKAYNDKLAGGTAPELLLSNAQTWTVSGIITGGAKEISLTFLSNKTTFSLTCSSTDYKVSGSGKSWTLTLQDGFSAPSTINLTLKNTGSSNARIDDVILKVTKETKTDTKVLVGIEISGNPIKTTYEAGEEFDPSGLTVKGTYDDASTETITKGIEWTVTPSGALAVGTTSVSVTATVGTITSSSYTVNGLTVNEHVITPGTYDIIPNTTFFGIETQTTGSHAAVTGSQNDITVVHSGGSNFYCNDNQIRTYKDNTLTISVPDGYVISSIVFAVTDNAAFNASVGTYTSSSKSWSGNAQEVVLTSKQSSGNYQITKITVTYEKAKIPTSIEVSGTPAEF